MLLFNSYDDDAEQITQYERIGLEDVDKIEIGKTVILRTPYFVLSFTTKS